MKEVKLKKLEIDYRGMSRPTAISVSSDYPQLHWKNEK